MNNPIDEANKSNKNKFDFRIFSILVVFSAVPILLGSWLLFRSYETAYQQMLGTHLSQTAETAFGAVNGYLQNQIIDIAGLTEVPSLREAVAAGNQDLKKNLEEVRKSIPKMAAAWPTLKPDSPQARSILDNSASRFLRSYIGVNKFYRDIIVTDFLGRLVACTDRNTNYYRAQSDWWKSTYGDGVRGSVFVGDVRYDSRWGTYVMDVAQPFIETEGAVVGVIKVTVDLQGIHELTGSIQAGTGINLALMRANGDVISAPGYGTLGPTHYPAIVDILNAREKGRQYLFATTATPSAVYGLSRRDLKELYPNLNWIVVATGKTDEVLRPLPQLRRYLIALLLGVFMVTLLAALMVSREESRPVIEEDPHLEQL